MKKLRWQSGVVVAGVVAGALLLSACTGGGDPINRDPQPVASQSSPSGGAAGAAGASSGTPGASHDSITISNFMFSPMTITVAPGAVIKVTNKDSAAHTLTSTDGTLFNSGIINQNQTKPITAPTKPGKYSYICNIHQYMMGTINVS
jgi:plastocyanin